MFSKEEILKLKEQVEELSHKIDVISEKQNSQFTDIVLQIKELGDLVRDKKDDARNFTDGDQEGTDDGLYENAKECVISSGKASPSFLQRLLGIGYSRAAKLIDVLEDEGVIGPLNGSKPREVLIKPEDENCSLQT